MTIEDDDGENVRKNKGQFKKGVSGNLRGRPKRPERSFLPEQYAHDTLAKIEEPMAITVNGVPKKAKAMDLFIQSLKAEAAKGDKPAGKLLREMQKECSATIAQSQPKLVESIQQLRDFISTGDSRYNQEAVKLQGEYKRRTRK